MGQEMIWVKCFKRVATLNVKLPRAKKDIESLIDQNHLVYTHFCNFVGIRRYILFWINEMNISGQSLLTCRKCPDIREHIQIA